MILALTRTFFKRPPKARPLPLNPLSTMFCAYLEAVKSPDNLEVERLADAIALALVDARAVRIRRVCVAYLRPGAAWREGASALERRGVTLTKRNVRHGVFVYASLKE